jgi:hypothetical protein
MISVPLLRHPEFTPYSGLKLFQLFIGNNPVEIRDNQIESIIVKRTEKPDPGLCRYPWHMKNIFN